MTVFGKDFYPSSNVYLAGQVRNNPDSSNKANPITKQYYFQNPTQELSYVKYLMSEKYKVFET